jgi:hypothetical protein
VQISKSDRKLSRQDVALSIEKALKILDLRELSRLDRATFASGKGTAVFGEFVGLNEESLGIGSVFSSGQDADGLQTAICLFGSAASSGRSAPSAVRSARSASFSARSSGNSGA